MEIQSGVLTLAHTQTVARDTLLLRFESDVVLNYKPGQFVSMEFGPKAWRAYSIASHPSEDHIELVVRLVEGGVASEIFRTAEVGQTFNFKGPFGHFILSDNQAATLNFCATGTGIAPLRSMIIEEAAQDSPRPMRLFYGGRDAEDIAYLDQLSSWYPELEVHLGLSRQARAPETDDFLSPGLDWAPQRITNFLEEFEFSNNDEFYLCGSGPMVKSVNEVLAEKNIEKTQIFQERFN